MKNPFHTEMIATFCAWYKEVKGIRYNFLGIDARKIDDIYTVLRSHWDEVRPGLEPTCKAFMEYFRHFLEYIPHLHKWLFDNLDLKNIASKAQIVIGLIQDRQRNVGEKSRTATAPKDLNQRLQLLNLTIND